ncbi:MBL fold metallo-hydrolase [Sinomonas terrae]|uniref:MBL fold metallo-hydrolase n=1 Tax=Sinomonas terrae TaxID=2908838 RepID=A0ABS9U5S5_9MICC|nr:MBL fold metallo-hydrolase [Sinomonas terrae]MCH6471887.1 MBL fold metallo-hydrolase [Sinomonas terrae]
MTESKASRWVQSSELTRYRLAPNPGPMSLDGTNSYVISGEFSQVPQKIPGQEMPGQAGVVVVDPGPLEATHLGELAAAGRVELVLITHHHSDHTEGAEEFHRITGAPVRALDASLCFAAPPLADGEVIEAAGVRIEVLATPGHTADSVSLLLPDDGDEGSVLTGDTILGRGTTVIAYPDGRLGDYLASLRRLEALGPKTVLPAHGPVLPDLGDIVRAYAAHREERLAQIREALASLGAEAPVGAVTDVVYADVETSVRRAAETSVAAQLDYLRGWA